MKKREPAVAGLSGVKGDSARVKTGRGTWETRQGGGQDQPGQGINNLTRGAGRESDRLVVAEKRVTTVERRGLTGNMLSEKEGEPLGRETHYGRTTD